MLIPPGPAKTTSDVVAAGGSLLGFFQSIPWSEVAAFASFVYLSLRIAEFLWEKWKNR